MTPSTDHEVFEHLTQDDESFLEIDFLTYAIYAVEKFQWMEQCKAKTGNYPSEAEISRWISDLTELRFTSLRGHATDLFELAARRFMLAEVEQEKELAVRNSILNEVKSAGSAWRQLAIAMITAILAPLIIGGVIVAALSYDRVMYSIQDITHQLQPPGKTGP